MNRRVSFHILLPVLVLFFSSAAAGPYIPAGDLALRHDIQRLADAGVIKGPTTTWPLAWGPIMADLADAELDAIPVAVASSMRRVRERAAWETRSDEALFNARAAAAEDPTRIRGFRNTPRGNVDVSAGAAYTSNRFSAEINLHGTDSEQDSEDVRFDNSLIGGVIGNWSVGASTQERWWGPGWDGSLILSNNARPMPALVVDRIFTDPWRTKWLSWLGPWDFSMMFGQLEKERSTPNARFFGMRVTIRPLPQLELGVSRSAQWCGDGRPCGFDTFVDLFVGRDNIGDAGIGSDNEPGNQLAGFDFRWSKPLFGYSLAAYGQFIGEDEAGGFPSRWLGLVGGEVAGRVRNDWSMRVFGEFSGTSCEFYNSGGLPNCAYNHNLYADGYRYRGRTIGHAVDNDARIVSFGAVFVNEFDTQWRGLLRAAELNRVGSPDSQNSLTPLPQDVVSIDLSHSRVFEFGVIDAGLGFERVDDAVNAQTSDNTRFYVQWRSSF